MSTIADVGRKILESKREFKWENLGNMCYSTVVGNYLILVKKDMFQIRRSGDEIDTARNLPGVGEGTWIRQLWRRAHDAVLAREHVFDGILLELDI